MRLADLILDKFRNPISRDIPVVPRLEFFNYGSLLLRPSDPAFEFRHFFGKPIILFGEELDELLEPFGGTLEDLLILISIDPFDALDGLIHHDPALNLDEAAVLVQFQAILVLAATADEGLFCAASCHADFVGELAA